MTKQQPKNKLKELTKAIQAAVPEIKWIKCNHCGYVHSQGNFRYCDINGCQGFLNQLCKTGERDITLEDCLRALHKEIKKDNISYSDGYEHIVNLCYREQQDSWLLGKPLNDQPIPTINLLHGLLCYSK